MIIMIIIMIVDINVRQGQTVRADRADIDLPVQARASSNKPVQWIK